ncbi:MAG TPA: 16S rRNA (uracil(1498)-N(3))-methyltransferase [Bdellovibrionota bacterium]|nr:16S rRNA (uracil(1498)-N(3))-methyltransferase [Bdellovibrionota bacterium]
MKRVLCPDLPKPGKPVQLAASEARHAVHVLRLRNGDTIEALDGKGSATPALLKIRGDSVWLEFLPGAPRPEPQHSVMAASNLVLEMAVLKGDAMEWVVEKSVELNVRKLVPVLTAHTVVQMKHKGPEVFQERWQKIADQALKQCGRLEKMEIALPRPLGTTLEESLSPSSVRLFCDENARNGATPLARWLCERPSAIADIRLLIGPEGGWSQEEREFITRTAAGSKILHVSLGPLVLRAETAALFGISLISGIFQAYLETKQQD